MTEEPDRASEVARRWRAATAAGGVVVPGIHAVKHAIRFGARLPLVLAADPAGAVALAGELAPDIVARLRSLLVPVRPELLRELAGAPPRGGVAAVATPPEPVAPLWCRPRVAPLVLLENPRDLGNVGAVIRLVAGLGGSGVVTTGTVDPWHPQALRGSAGLHFAVPVQRAPAGWIPELAGPVLAFDPTGRDLLAEPVPAGAVLLFGGERHGLSAAALDRADRVVALPLAPGVSSYNLATSVAMGLFHWVGQR